MVNVSIEGALGNSIGKKWTLHVTTVGEVVRAMRANVGQGFHKIFRDMQGCVLVVDGEPIEHTNWFLKKIKKNLTIVPVLGGGAVFIPAYFAIAGALLASGITTSLAIAGIVAITVIVAVVALVAYGVYMLITKLSERDPSSFDAVGSTSYLFSGAENVTTQGNVVPVGYGRLKVGSKVISVAASNIDMGQWERWRVSDFEVNIPVVGTDIADILIDGAKMSTDRIRTG
jgi:predicted phage tail protein